MSRRAPSVARPSDSHSSPQAAPARASSHGEDRKSTRLNSSHGYISYAVFCLKKKKKGRASATLYHLKPSPDVATHVAHLVCGRMHLRLAGVAHLTLTTHLHRDLHAMRRSES